MQVVNLRPYGRGYEDEVPVPFFGNMTSTPHPNRRRLFSALAALALLAAALWWLTGYDNYHVVIPGELYRSGQMSANRLLAHAAADRLATVINLRPETNQPWHTTEVAACAGQHITHIDFPLAGDKAPTRDRMQALMTLMRTAPKPLLIHCEHGADRTGLAVALYLSAVNGRPRAEAKRALSIRYGHSLFFGMDCFDKAFDAFCRDMRRTCVASSDRGRERGLNSSPPSEPDRRISRIRLSS